MIVWKQFGIIIQNPGHTSIKLILYLYNVKALKEEIKIKIPQLLPEQKVVLDYIMEKIASNTGALLFVDAPGGNGKTFLINIILSIIRSENKIALAVASSGIAATLPRVGRTAHSLLELPLNLINSENPIYDISKNSNRANLLRNTKFMAWDEVTVSYKQAIEAVDRSLKDIRDNNQIMGGMVVLLAGDFRQTLPVVPKGTLADQYKECIKSSHLWNKVKFFHLTKNMRVYLHNHASAEQFCKTLLEIGKDKITKNEF